MSDLASLREIVSRDQQTLLEDWMRLQLGASTLRPDLLNEKQLREQSREFLAGFAGALSGSDGADVRGPAWSDLRGTLADLSRSRARQGFSSSETATFVLSLKEPIFERLRRQSTGSAGDLAMEIWQATKLLDQLALLTTDAYLHEREDVIRRQQEELLELSTPVVRLWEGVLALPLIGTLDSARTQIVMEGLLQELVRAQASIAIIDITGVPTVDTLVAQHLLKTVAAARLMGADCIISGIRPQIAQTIVHLGVDLTAVTTKASLADALAQALKRLGLTVQRVGK